MKSKCGVSNEISGVALNSLEDMEQAHNDGATVLMMIDSQMFDDIVSYSYNDLFTKSHWIVYEGGLTFYDAEDETVENFCNATRLVFRFVAWGKSPTESSLLLKHGNISIACFKSTFYGCIICKNGLNEMKEHV